MTTSAPGGHYDLIIIGTGSGNSIIGPEMDGWRIAVVERFKFTTYIVFLVLWVTLVYSPVAHWVWASTGWLFMANALDFAGGTVVHINAAVAGLVGAYMVGKRIGYGKESFTPHSLTLTMVGASLLWVGWFGFNAGSALEANGFAALAFINTLFATAAAVLAWCVGEALLKGKASMLGAASGAVAGLVAITPAAGNVGIGGGLVIGLIAGFACLWGVSGLKKLLGADDSLDVFGVHGVGGILGALLTGVFASPALGGTGVYDYVSNSVAAYDMAAQMMSQLWGVGVAVVVFVLGIGWWITSALESNVGLNAIAQFVSQYPLTTPQGLGTGMLYENNFDAPLVVDKAQLRWSADAPWTTDFSATE